MEAESSPLAIIFKGWVDYWQQLNKAVAPLTPEQLALRAAPELRSAYDLISHIIAARAGWLYQGLHIGDATIGEMADWDLEEGMTRTAADLIAGLTTTQQLIQQSLNQWTPADLTKVVIQENDGQVYRFPRAWVIWHLIEHDLHHGGELASTLRMHGLEGPEI